MYHLDSILCSSCSERAFISVVAIQGIGVLALLIGIGVLVFHWRRPIFRLSQRSVILAYLLGSLVWMLTRASYILQMLDDFDSQFVCWVASIGYFPVVTFLLTLLTIKEYKVYKLYEHTLAMRKMESIDKKLGLYVALSTLVTLLLVVARQATNRTKAHLYYFLQTQEARPTHKNDFRLIPACDPVPTHGFILDSRSDAYYPAPDHNLGTWHTTFLVTIALQISVHMMLLLYVGLKCRKIPSVARESTAVFILLSIGIFCICFGFVGYFIIHHFVAYTLEYDFKFGWAEVCMTIVCFCPSVSSVYLLVLRKLKWVSCTERQLRQEFLSESFEPSEKGNSPSTEAPTLGSTNESHRPSRV